MVDGELTSPGSRKGRAGWFVLAALALLAALGVASFSSGGCASGGECRTVVAGGPAGWVLIALLVALAAGALRKGLRR